MKLSVPATSVALATLALAGAVNVDAIASDRQPRSTVFLPIKWQSVSDRISSGADILSPIRCALSANIATASGTYRGFVPEDYLRVGDVVELYVYSRPVPGFRSGIQLGVLSKESSPHVTGGHGGSWSAQVPVDRALGRPARCAVTVQATHQREEAGNAY